MVRVEFPIHPAEAANAEYRKITRSAYRLIKGTWGYSALDFENWQIEPKEPLAPSIAQSPAQILSSLFNTDYVSVLRGYVCFKDEMNALQFRLSISTKAVQVKMWPKKEFTIHEVIETDE